MVLNIKNTFIAAILTLCCASTSYALPSVSIPPSDSGTYIVQGTEMDRVAGIQIDITYDATSLKTPTVTQGGLVSGAMLAANTTLPGIIKIAIISTRAFSGSGPIATISFASKTGSGGITSVKTSMIDIKGTPVGSSGSSSPGETPASGLIQAPGVPFSQPSQPSSTSAQQQGTSAAAASGAAAAPVLGAVTLPAEQPQRTDSQPAPASAVPEITGETVTAKIAEQPQPSAVPAADSKPQETPQYNKYRGVLDRFKQYSGSKDLASMTALFDKEIAPTVRQVPPLLLSDGHSKAALTVDIPARISTSPNFAVNGGALVSFKQDNKVNGRWTVVVLPEAGAVRVTATIIAGAEEFESPLTVAPPAKTTLTLDKSGWKRFLKETGTPSAPLHDLNNDGVRDYIDEYIFVANLLARKTSPAKQSPPTNKSAK
jgi:hypothetical protein